MAYTNSPLVTYTNITNHKTSPRTHAIDTITIHCLVAQWTAKKGCDFFVNTDKECSANYVVGNDGSIGLSVEEKDRSWCSSNATNDHRAVTIEVASDIAEPYAVTDAAYNALIKLVADICKRNGIKKLVWSTNKSDRLNHTNGCNMTVHRDFANKSCPGTYLYERQGQIAEAVNAILNADTATSTTISTTSGTLYRIQAGAYKNKTNATTQLNKVKAKSFDACIVEADGFYKIQIGAYGVKANAEAQLKRVQAAGFSATIVTASGSTQATQTADTFKSYTAQVTVNALNIRKGPGTEYNTNGVIRDKGAYSIVAESTGQGASMWGKLKSGAGWISLDFVKKL